MEDRVLMQFSNDKQAKSFFNWFVKHGFNQFMTTVKTDISCISSEEKPGATSDPSAYYIEIE